MGGQEHFYMETQSMLVVPKGEDQEMDVYVSTQFPRYIQVTWATVVGTLLNDFYQQNTPRAITSKNIISL